MKKLSLLFLVIMSSFVNVKAQNENQITSQQSHFRYIIAFNDLNKLDEKSNILNRNLMVLMEKNAFNEANLKKLYILITKRFPKPYSFIVVVFTDLAELPTPEERELKPSLTVSTIKPIKTSWALMYHLKNVSRIDITANSKNMIIEMPE